MHLISVSVFILREENINATKTCQTLFIIESSNTILMIIQFHFTANQSTTNLPQTTKDKKVDADCSMTETGSTTAEIAH